MFKAWKSELFKQKCFSFAKWLWIKWNKINSRVLLTTEVLGEANQHWDSDIDNYPTRACTCCHRHATSDTVGGVLFIDYIIWTGDIFLMSERICKVKIEHNDPHFSKCDHTFDEFSSSGGNKFHPLINFNFHQEKMLLKPYACSTMKLTSSYFCCI